MWSGIYQSPTPPSIGAWALVPLSYASGSGAARICQQGAKARDRSDRTGGGWGVSPSNDREILFWKFVHENGIFLHIKWVVYVVAYTNSLLFSFFFFFFLLADQRGGGGGAWLPCAPPSYASELRFGKQNV